MHKCFRIEIRAQFTVETHQQVLIERCSDSSRIILSGQQRLFALDQIHAQQ